jgi:hypothetical protein
MTVLPPLLHEFKARILQALIGVALVELGIGLYLIVRGL